MVTMKQIRELAFECAEILMMAGASGGPGADDYEALKELLSGAAPTIAQMIEFCRAFESAF